MKTTIDFCKLSLLINLLAIMILSSCSTDWYNDVPQNNQPDSEWGSGQPVNASNPDDISDNTAVKDGDVEQGNPPRTTTNVQHPPRIWGNVTSVTTTSDQTLYLPFSFEVNPASDGLRNVFVQVEGASTYWSIRYYSNNHISGDIILEIKLPPNIQTPDDFTVNYRIQDDLGLVSNVLETKVKVVDVDNCGGNFEGHDGLTVRSFDLGNTGGRVRITYDMYTVPDRLDVFYGGNWVSGTGSSLSRGQNPPISKCYDGTNGYVSGSGYFDIQHDPSKSRRLDIYASGCVGGGTKWIIWLECPQ